MIYRIEFNQLKTSCTECTPFLGRFSCGISSVSLLGIGGGQPRQVLECCHRVGQPLEVDAHEQLHIGRERSQVHNTGGGQKQWTSRPSRWGSREGLSAPTECGLAARQAPASVTRYATT